MAEYSTEAEFSPTLPSSGLDRLGEDGLVLGTPTTEGAVTLSKVNSLNNFELFGVEEYPDSPEFERAEQCTVTHRFVCTWADGKIYAESFQRGTVFADSEDNLYKVLSLKIQSKKGGLCDLTIISEAITFDTPPDEFDIQAVQLNIDILKHPRYFFALNPSGQNATINITRDVYTIPIEVPEVFQGIIRAVQTYRDSPFFPSKDNINGLLHNNIMSQLKNYTLDYRYDNPNFNPSDARVAPIRITDANAAEALTTANCEYFIVTVNETDLANNEAIDMARSAALEIISKIWRCEDTPYVAGYQITWSQYFYLPQPLNPGGYVENPFDDGTSDGAGRNVDAQGNSVYIADPQLPDYFYSSETPPDPNVTIFDDLPVLNAASYSNDGTQAGKYSISWLRQADTIHYERTWFKVTRTWIGSPVGHWDYELYGGDTVRPTVASDYNTIG